MINVDGLSNFFKLKKDNKLIYLFNTSIYPDLICNKSNTISFLNFINDKLLKSQNIILLHNDNFHPKYESVTYVHLQIQFLREIIMNYNISKLETLQKFIDYVKNKKIPELNEEINDLLDSLYGIFAIIKLLDKTSDIKLIKETSILPFNSYRMNSFSIKLQQNINVPDRISYYLFQLEKLLYHSITLFVTIEICSNLKNQIIVHLCSDLSHFYVAKTLINKFGYELEIANSNENLDKKIDFFKNNSYSEYSLIFNLNPTCCTLENFEKF